MVETRREMRALHPGRDTVDRLIRRDFPSVELSLGSRLADLETKAGSAVVLPEEEISVAALGGLDHMLFPPGEEAAGLGLVFAAGDALLQSIRRFYLPPVIFAGAGPGGAGNLTVDAARAVASADLILADCLCGEDVLRDRREGSIVVPVGKRGGAPSISQEEIGRRIALESRRGRRVVRLKGGDPCVFGRLEEEIAVLCDLSLSYRVIPGVGAASAAGAYTGQPLAARGAASEIILSTGRLAGGGKNLAPLSGSSSPSIALYMSRRILGDRMAALEGAGFPGSTPVVLVSKIGSPEVRVVTGTVATIAGEADRQRIGTPAVALVGKHFREPRHLPLLGVRIWLSAERETAESHRLALEELGAACVVEPLIEPVALDLDVERVLAKPFDWIVFTSKKSVDFLFDLLGERGLDSRWLPRVAAIGSPTIRKLRARGIEPDVIPPEPTRVALSATLIETGLAGKRVLIPASAVAPDHVREALRPHAAEVVRVDLYTLRHPDVRSVPDADVVLFSSESTVLSARQSGLIEEIRRRGMVAGGIGPATRRRLVSEGLAPAIAPDGMSPARLARATHRYFANLEVAAMGAGRP